MRISLLFFSAAIVASPLIAAHAASSAPDATVVEFHHRGVDRYFMTAIDFEKQLLDDKSVNSGFERTGRSFSAWSKSATNRPTDALEVTRFFMPTVSSHFYTAREDEKALLRKYPQWYVDEGTQFFIQTANASGCATGTKAIYRAFNNRKDANHRYSNEVEVHASMTKLGFADEKTAFCAATVSTDLEQEKKAGTPGSIGEDLKVSGTVSNFVSISNFMLGTQKVDASNARFDNAASSALANGVSITVEGVIVNGVLVATEVKFPKGAVAAIDEFKGFVTALGTAGKFFVNGIAVDAANAVVVGGTLASISIGREVEVHGNYVDAVFVATRVEIEDEVLGNPTTPVTAGSAEIKGVIANFVSVSDFMVAGQKVNAKDASFEDGTAASLANGVSVEVNGTIKDGVLVASRVEIKSGNANDNGGNPPVAGSVEAFGAITNFVSVSSFAVNGQTVNASKAVFNDGTPASLANGVVVEVHGDMVNGVLMATRVEIKSTVAGGNNPPDAIEFEAKGAVSAFVSVSSFVVGGKTIDASAASFERGTAANLRNGVIVEVKGTVVGGLVKATRVRFEK
jgi:Domain of unknown function (DUF5666)/Repeat of unknown function (DUF5648)